VHARFFKPFFSTTGLFAWMLKVFTPLRVLLNGPYEWQARTMAAAKRMRHPPARRAPLFSLAEATRSDLKMILRVLQAGVSFRSVAMRAVPRSPSAIQVVIHVDWAGKAPFGQGGVVLSTGEWFTHTPSAHQRAALVSTKGHPSSPAFEGATVPVALSTFRGTIAGKCVLLCIDNLPFVQAADKGSSDVPAIAEVLRIMAMAQVLLHCHLVVDHIMSGDNFSDPLSRGDLESFLARCAAAGLPADEHPQPAPAPPGAWCPPTSLLFDEFDD
jgi:hypothetical protein